MTSRLSRACASLIVAFLSLPVFAQRGSVPVRRDITVGDLEGENTEDNDEGTFEYKGLLVYVKVYF